MKRIFMLMALALMLAAAMALSGVAQAAGSPSAKCQQEAASLGLNLVGYKFIGGNNKKNDDFTRKATTGVPEVFCGFGGNDSIATINGGVDIFIGGDGQDSVGTLINGTFNGGAGDDSVGYVGSGGLFNGGEGTDSVFINDGGTLVDVP
jgi:hypothetical protein